MKITLLTDLSGKIICASYRQSNYPGQSTISTQISPTPEQQLNNLDIPAELHGHVLDDTLELEIFNYKVDGTGENAKLVKESGK
jgi:hypothetical protein